MSCEYSVRAMEHHDTRSTKKKFDYSFHPRSRKRFVGAETDVIVISAVTCRIIV